MIELVFETHSTSDDNERGIATGWLPGRLAPIGREQAAALGERRRGTVDVAFVSDLRRAVETFEIAFAGTELPVHLDARLRECDYGDLNGAAAPEIHAQRGTRVDTPWPNGQSYRDCVDAMRSFLTELRAGFDGRHVLVIGHSATRWSLDHLLAGRDLAEAVAAPFDWQPGWHYTLGE